MSFFLKVLGLESLLLKAANVDNYESELERIRMAVLPQT